MHSEELKKLLCNAALRVAGCTFARLSALGPDPWVEEFGSPDDAQAGDYCQIEAELLDRFTEAGAEVLHVAVTASDGRREFGTDVFVYSDGRSRWDRKVYEFVDGVPVLAGACADLGIP